MGRTRGRALYRGQVCRFRQYCIRAYPHGGIWALGLFDIESRWLGDWSRRSLERISAIQAGGYRDPKSTAKCGHNANHDGVVKARED